MGDRGTDGQMDDRQSLLVFLRLFLSMEMRPFHSRPPAWWSREWALGLHCLRSSVGCAPHRSCDSYPVGASLS